MLVTTSVVRNLLNKSSNGGLEDIIAKLRTFKVLLSDVDGVWFTGHEVRFEMVVMGDRKVVIAKQRHYRDGQGLSFLRALKVRVLFVTAEGEPFNSNMEKLNNLPSVQNGLWSKVEMFEGKIGTGEKVSAIEGWLKENHFKWGDCVYFGDDLNDYPPMLKVREAGGLVVVPANATRRPRAIADLVTENSGGSGAIREFVELVLDARGIDELNLPVS